MLRDFVSIFFPKNCLNCRQSLISAEEYICTACKIDLPVTKDTKNPTNDLYQKFAFEPKVKSAASFLYFHKGGIAQKLLHELKYKGKKEIGLLLGKWFASSLSQRKVDFILPVPIHITRVRKRTYNQSEIIAHGISDVLGLEIRKDLISRIVATESQTSRSKAERWMNIANVYSDVTEDLTGKSILIVDDVITTGATIGMLCQRLVASNVEAIHIASIARGK